MTRRCQRHCLLEFPLSGTKAFLADVCFAPALSVMKPVSRWALMADLKGLGAKELLLTMYLTELERSAEQGWESLLTQADLPQQGWSLTQLSKREDAQSARIVYRATHLDGFCYTFKHQLRPPRSEAFQRQFDTHKAVFETFAGSSEHQVPKPIWIKQSPAPAALVSSHPHWQHPKGMEVAEVSERPVCKNPCALSPPRTATH